MSANIDYEKLLNPSQLDAVMALDGPVLVIAGAGSGKTRTLVYKVARLVETGVPPENILLLTFTRKASGEMLERAAGLSDERCRNVSGGTFHSLAHRVLRQHAHILGFPSAYTILDRSDMEEVVQSLVREMNVERGSIRFPRRGTLANILSKAANHQRTIEVLLEEEFSQYLEYMPQVNRLAELYDHYKRTNGLMDYDDLILNFRQLLSENEGIRRELSEQYRYIMVDEYQDTNGIQADIVKWLGSSHCNIMVVGDDSQSIYSFRGANYRNMFDFPTLFSDTRIIKLEENYRSTQPILTFTNALMDQAREKYTKCLYTRREDGELPKVINARTDPEQALYICHSIKERVQQGHSLSEMAVLFRAGHHSFELEMELARQSIPFVKYGGFKFMESAHIKDVLAHLRVLLNGNDTISWGRILRLIKNIGHSKSQAILEWLKEEGCQPGQIAEWPGAGKGNDGLKVFSQLMKQLSEKKFTPQKAVEAIIKYYEPTLKEKFDDFPRRQRDLEQLVSMGGRYQKMQAFLDDLLLEPPSSTADLAPREGEDVLTLSTVHSAKGLEWDCVIIIWVMEGYFPSARAGGSEEDMEEERRLMYVAATRAKNTLILCYPGEETPPAWFAFGNAGMGYRGGLSSFIQALPTDVMELGSSGRQRVLSPLGRKPQRRFEKKGKKPPSSELRSGDRVSHPAFGPGVISKFVDSEKVEVLFRDAGRKLLHLGYTTLEKT